MNDRGTFLGHRLPPYMRHFAKTAPSVSKNTFRLLVQLAVNLIEKRPIVDDALQKVEGQVGAVENLEELFAGVFFIINTFLRLPAGKVKKDQLAEDLKELNLNEESVADLTSVLFGPKRANWELSLAADTPRWPSIQTLNWNLDMAISQSESKVFEPCIALELELSDGKKYKFHVSLAQFHTLRHRVAALLAEISSLEKRAFFKQ
ncbi:COMM domain-containing protein 5-like [Cloeon dipterum]|uniref:COMM domain-containing protein 5-like n=1 Tax=Cloeon dipterum TaxID=197152 RepID=UPI0032205DEC